MAYRFFRFIKIGTLDLLLEDALHKNWIFFVVIKQRILELGPSTKLLFTQNRLTC